MHALFGSLVVIIVLAWLAHQLRPQYPSVATVFYIIATALAVLCVVVFFGLN